MSCTAVCSGHPNFITGAGGFLQNVINGYGGLRITPTAMTIKPTLPLGGVSRIVFRALSYKSERFTVAFNATSLSVELLGTRSGSSDLSASASAVTQAAARHGADSAALVDQSGARYTLQVGMPLSLSLQQVAIECN